MGFPYIALSGLDFGRYSTAWGGVAIAQAALDASLHYTSTREQFGATLQSHQLIQGMITDMVANVQAARLLCCQAGYLPRQRRPSANCTNHDCKILFIDCSCQACLRCSAAAWMLMGADRIIRCSAIYEMQRSWKLSKEVLRFNKSLLLRV